MGLPPVFAPCGAKVVCATNCSPGKRLKSGPYSLSTTSIVSTPMASICVAWTPLIRYHACRFASCPRFLIALALLAFCRGGAVWPRCCSPSISPSFRRISFSCRVRFLVPSRHPRQPSCIHQQHLQTLPLQHLVRRNPINPRALHPARLYLSRFQPLRYPNQFPSHGPEAGYFSTRSHPGSEPIPSAVRFLGRSPPRSGQ